MRWPNATEIGAGRLGGESVCLVVIHSRMPGCRLNNDAINTTINVVFTLHFFVSLPLKGRAALVVVRGQLRPDSGSACLRATTQEEHELKRMTDRANLRLTLCAALIGSLAACGGGGSGGSQPASGESPATPVATTQLSGKAIDGYLAGATVCFDNGQGACDTSLPTAVTDTVGNYTLKVTGDVSGRQLDVIVTPTTTDGGKAFTSTFTLSAFVSGSTQNVTPLTTMVVSQVKAGKSQQDAAQAVQQLVGSGVDPNADYVANGDSATTAIAASMVSHMTTLAGQGPVSWSQVQATMNAYAKKGVIEGVQQSDVDAQLTDPAYSSPIDAATALASPLFTVDGDLMQEIIGNPTISPALSPVRENFTLSGLSLSVTQEAQSNGNWVAASPVGGYDVMFSGSWISNDGGVGAYLMKADGSWTNWLTAAQLHPSYSLSSVGSTLVGTDPNTNDTLTVSYRTTDVSGQPLSSALQIDYRNPVRQSMTGTFPSGTTAYLSTTSYANDQLVLVNQGFGTALVNGATVSSSAIVNGSVLNTLGDPNVTYTSVQQAVGTQTMVSPCDAISILPNGVAQMNTVGSVVNGFDCSKHNAGIAEPVVGTWSLYPRNPGVITISFPKAIGAPTVVIDDDVKNVINRGGSLVVALMNGKLMGGFMLPATQPQTVAQFRSPVTDTIAASMRVATAKLGIQQNP